MKSPHSPERWLYRLVGRFVPNLKETWLRGQQIGGSWRHSLHITPALVCTPWHKSCLATIEDLGITTHSITVGVEWLRWYWCLTFGVSTQKPRRYVCDMSDIIAELEKDPPQRSPNKQVSLGAQHTPDSQHL